MLSDVCFQTLPLAPPPPSSPSISPLQPETLGRMCHTTAHLLNGFMTYVLRSPQRRRSTPSKVRVQRLSQNQRCSDPTWVTRVICCRLNKLRRWEGLFLFFCIHPSDHSWSIPSALLNQFSSTWSDTTCTHSRLTLSVYFTDLQTFPLAHILLVVYSNSTIILHIWYPLNML